MMTVYIKLCLVFTALLISASSDAQDDKQYIIEAQFEGLPDQTSVVLRTQFKDTLQTAISEGDKVSFTGTLNPEGQFLFIVFDQKVSDKSTKAIFVRNKKIYVKGNVELSEIKVSGSKEQDDYDKLLEFSRVSDIKINKLFIDMNNMIPTLPFDTATHQLINSSDQKMIDSMSNLLTKYRNNYYDSIISWTQYNPTSLLAPYLLANILSKENILKIRETLKLFSPKTLNSHYGRVLSNELRYADFYLQLQANTKFPDISVFDQNGNTFSIQQIAQKNKVTLIDCWASWCAPCRAETPRLKDIYNRYKNKGFEIVSISSDKNKSNWIKAVNEDSTSWKHFIEKPESPFSKMCGIESIPAYILLDQNGNLIAFYSAISIPGNIGPHLNPETLPDILDQKL